MSQNKTLCALNLYYITVYILLQYYAYMPNMSVFNGTSKNNKEQQYMNAIRKNFSTTEK